MKYILLFLLLGLSSCTCDYSASNSKSVPVINGIESISRSLSKYSINNTIGNYEFKWFVDSTGKFNIGDTIHFTK